MAFLCPVRIRNNGRKSKKKKGEEIIPVASADVLVEENFVKGGRITGSSSIETLVRVGLEKQGSVGDGQVTRTVLHDFTPCVDDELEVKRGEVVSLLYRENDWAYVMLIDDSREGFIPFSYLSNEIIQQQFESPFYKDNELGRYMVLYTFIARDENDLSVERGELIRVLNKDDPDWFWVVRSSSENNGQEGFVPSAFVFPLNFIQQQQQNSPNSLNSQNSQNQNNNRNKNKDFSDEQPTGTELVMLYDYKAQTPEDLSVRRGDWLYADMNQQTVEGWLWGFAPRQKKYGFIPKAYARPPAMTSL